MFLADVAAHEAPGMAELRPVGMPIPEILHLLAFKVERTGYLSRFTQDVIRAPSLLSPGFRELIAASHPSSTSVPSDCIPLLRSQPTSFVIGLSWIRS